MIRRAGPVVLLAAAAGCAAPEKAPREPEARALSYLAGEVPAWRAETGCSSCHHNGDAARALFTARSLGHAVPAASLADTLEWLSQPGRWDRQKESPAFNDRALAHLQFAAALAAAKAAGLARDRRAEEEAVRAVTELQAENGAWPMDPPDALGSPATWGTHLGTAMACRTLEAFDGPRSTEALERGRGWLRAAPIGNVLEAAAVLLGLAPASDARAADAAGPRVAECLSLLERGRAPGGGWGPYLNSPPEPFDTAVVLLALAELPPTPRLQDWLREGRGYLLATQREDGSWPATTRPPGSESRAQSTSTAGWATLALLRTAGGDRTVAARPRYFWFQFPHSWGAFQRMGGGCR